MIDQPGIMVFAISGAVLFVTLAGLVMLGPSLLQEEEPPELKLER